MTDWGQAAAFGGEAPGFGASGGIGERGERGRAGSAAGRRLEETRRTARRSVVCGMLGNGTQSSFRESTRGSSASWCGGENEN
jgi:hypothetical protein